MITTTGPTLRLVGGRDTIDLESLATDLVELVDEFESRLGDDACLPEFAARLDRIRRAAEELFPRR